MKCIELTQNRYAIVDDEDFEELSQYKWHYAKGSYGREGYAKRDIYLGGGRKNAKLKTIWMHHIINVPKGMLVDHINGDRLDNRRSNLRICTPSQNQQNRKIQKSLSGFKGVSFRSRKNCWEVNITINGKAIYIGSSKDKVMAAKMYDKAANNYFGSFARLNFNQEIQ